MKILLINKFLYPKGGDALYTLRLGKLLSGFGHKVIFWGMQHPLNPEYPNSDHFVSHIDFNSRMSVLKKLQAAFRIIYSQEACLNIERVIQQEKPDIAHLNNFAHQISPSIINTLKHYDVPMVMTLHDYKPVCATALLIRNDTLCELCKKNRHYWCLLTHCQKNSYLKSLVNTLEMYLHHKILRSYDNIDVFISPSTFLKEKLKEMGFNKEIVHLPNFLDATPIAPQYYGNDNTIVYFGRLSKEKGLITLLDSIKQDKDITLKIIGEGPFLDVLRKKINDEKITNAVLVGYRHGDELYNAIRASMFVVVPSEWYENNPFSVIESFALGKPVIGANIGGIPELIRTGQTGLLFESGNGVDLKEKIAYLLRNKERVSAMGKNAREFVEQELNTEKHYHALMKIYDIAIQHYQRSHC